MPDGVVRAVNSGKLSEFEWKIENYTLRKQSYLSPYFKFEGESWYLSLFPNGNARYSSLCLGRSSGTSPIEVEFCISLRKTTGGEKSFERSEKNCFDGWGSYTINQWIPTSEFIDQHREFLRSGCLTIILTMKKEDSRIPESASAAAVSSYDSHHEDKISFDRKFCDKLVKCSQCDEVLSLKKWFEHVCQLSNAKAARSEAICSCCKESLYDDKIAFHNECLNKEAICPRCNKVVILQNWFDHVCQKGKNVPAAANTSEVPMVTEHGKILQDLKHMFLNKELSDVVLRVNGKEFPAHKVILAARSPVFASTFRHEMKENKTGIVDIEDCDPSIFPDFLRFLYYNDTSNLSVENVFGLFTIADKYDCEELRLKCVWFIIGNLTIETFCKALALALLHGEAELLRVTTDFFIENAAKILVTVDWQTFAVENPIESNELFIKYVNSISRPNK